MRNRLVKVAKGDVIRAEDLNAIIEAVESIGIRGVPPIFVDDGEIRYDGDPPGFWIKITGAPSGAKHPWQEVIPTTGGTWTNGTRSGTTSTDSAYELNGSTTTLTNKYARAWRDRSSYEVRFQYS